MPAAVLDIELCGLFKDITVSRIYNSAVALIRWRGKPLMRWEFVVKNGCLRCADIWQTAADYLKDSLKTRIVRDLFPGNSPTQRFPGLPCTVVVCTRNRTQDLRKCLDSLIAARTPETEILVVDNAPSDESTAELVARYPVRYVREMRKGLNWARARGIRSANQDLVLYTDDDVVVDPAWVCAMCEPFTDPSVTAVTGLIMPYELETRAQQDFERYGGFVHQFHPQLYTSSNLLPAAAGRVGAGASMAFRRAHALRHRIFEVEMDCGTASLSGGDHYAFYRVLRAGGTIVFKPDAVCWHRHRRTDRELRHTLYGYSVGVYSFLLRCLLAHHDPGALRVGGSFFYHHHLRHLLRGLLGKPCPLPLSYTLDEIRGVFAAPLAYWRTRRAEVLNTAVESAVATTGN